MLSHKTRDKAAGVALCLAIAIATGAWEAGAANTSSVVVDRGAVKLAVNGTPIDNMFGVYVYCTQVDPRTPQFLAEMRKVIDRTANLQIPVMSFDILWSDYDRTTDVPANPDEAAWRFPTESLDAVLDYAASRKVYVVLQLLVHDHWGLPAWWKQFANNSEAYQLLGPATQATRRYNRYQNPVASFNSPTHHALLSALITRLVDRYRDHPAVAGWGINVGPTGENGYAPNYIDIRFNKALRGIHLGQSMADYSPLAIRNFQSWLQTRYSRTATLNRHWHTGYASFGAVEAPTPGSLDAEDTFLRNGDARSSMRDWQTFRYEAILQEWRFLSTLVRALDPSKVVMGKTSWYPLLGMAPAAATMTVSAAGVAEERLIDMDKVDAGITAGDYEPGHLFYASRVDFAGLTRFSRSHRIVRVCNLENWMPGRSPQMPVPAIDPARAVDVRNAIRAEGGYLWFVVALDSDQANKPCWSWEDVNRLVNASSTNELGNVSAADADVAFYYDPQALFPHYGFVPDGLSAASLGHAVAACLFDTPASPGFRFVSRTHVLEHGLDADATRLLVVANQRDLSSSVARRLQDFVADSGVVLLIGSNGVFDGTGQRDAAVLSSLAPSLTGEQIKMLYQWGLHSPVRIPVLALSVNGIRLTSFALDGAPEDNYRRFRSVLSDHLPLPVNASLDLKGPANEPPPRAEPQGGGRPAPPPRKARGLIKDFDRNSDGVVSRPEFPGPDDVFRSLDINQDDVIDAKEAEKDDGRP